MSSNAHALTPRKLAAIQAGEDSFGLSSDRMRRVEAEQGSAALLAALLRAGIKRGGLEGLSAADFRAQCKAAGIIIPKGRLAR